MAGFGKPIEPQLTDERQADEEARKNKRFSALLAELYGDKNTDRFKSFAFPEDIKTNLNDVFDSYKVEKAKRSAVRRSLSEITVASTAVEGAHIKITKNSVKADMSQMDAAAKTQTALEMAMIAANNPNLMDSEGSIPLEGSAEDKLALYLAAQKLGFAEKIDQKTLEGVNELAPEKQQAIAEAMEASWAQAKESLSSFAADNVEPKNDENGEEKPHKDKKEKADFDKAAKGKSDDTSKPLQLGKEEGTVRVNTVQDIIKDFDDKNGKIAAKYTEYDRERGEGLKSKLLALHLYEQDTGGEFLPRFKGNLDMWGKVQTSEGEIPLKDFKDPEGHLDKLLKTIIPNEGQREEYLARAKEDVEQEITAPQGFVEMGEIMDNYGLIDRDDKNTILLAQAATRTLDRVGRLEAGTPQEEKNPNKLKFAHLGKFPDPSELGEAQEMFQTATIAEQAAARGVDLKDVLGVETPDVGNIKNSAVRSLDKAIAQFQERGHTAAVEALTQVKEHFTAEPAAAKPAPAADAKLAGWGLKPNNG